MVGHHKVMQIAVTSSNPIYLDLKRRHRFSVAPMMDCTDRHARYLLRLISRHVLLYTEMVTTGALIFGNHDRMLDYHQSEHPVVLQLGGSDPMDMARCARMGERWGYDEINMNVGCPSDRVQSGAFGVCLMKQPAKVADCIRAMQDAVSIPVTIKHRIGVDQQDSMLELERFVETIARADCKVFIIHARKAWLQGLSPKQNREIPPLKYQTVYAIKSRFPELTVIINGGFNDLESSNEQLKYVDGVMLGRAAYNNPYLLNRVDQLFFDDDAVTSTRHEVLFQYLDYCESQLVNGVRLHHLIRPAFGLFQGCRGARRWRRYLSERIYKPTANLDEVKQAAEQVER